MRVSKETIIKNALSLIQEPDFELYTSGDRAKFADSNFNTAFRKILGRYSWSFFLKKKELINRQKVEESEDFSYSYKYSLPDRLVRIFTMQSSFTISSPTDIPRVLLDGSDSYYPSPGDYEVHGNFLYTNSDRPFIMYQHDDLDNAGVLSPSFITALEYAVASHLATSIEAKKYLSDKYLKLFERECQVAISSDRLSLKEGEADSNAFGGLL